MSGRATRGPGPRTCSAGSPWSPARRSSSTSAPSSPCATRSAAHDAEAEFSETQAAGLTLADASARWPRRRCSQHPLRRGPRAREPPRRVRRRAARLRRRAGRRRRAGARARRRRRRAAGVLTKLRKLAGGHRGQVGGAAAERVPAVRGRRGPPATARASTRTPPTFLVQAVGQDLRSLAAAADQLTNDFPGEAIDGREGASKYFGGRAEAKSFAVADAAFWGRRAGRARGAALGARRRHRRRCWSPRRSPARRARAWPATRRAPRGMREADLAREVGRAAVEAAHHPRPVPGLVRRRASPGRSARSPRPTPTSRARPATPSYTLERLVLTITGLRDAPLTRRLELPRNTTTRPEGPDGSWRAGQRQSEAAFLAIADLRFAAWFLWMTPLEAALSSLLEASRPSSMAWSFVAGLGGLAELAHGGLQAGLDGLVALVTLLVLLVPLDLGLDVRHWASLRSVGRGRLLSLEAGTTGRRWRRARDGSRYRSGSEPTQIAGRASVSAMPRRRSAPTSMRRDSLIRKSLSVGRLTSTAVCARQARNVANPTSQASTAVSPAAARAGEEASDASNHGRVHALQPGEERVQPAGPDRRPRPSRGRPARPSGARGGCRCGCRSARARTSWSREGRGRAAPRCRCRRRDPVRAAAPAGSPSARATASRPLVEALPGGRPGPRRRRPVRGGSGTRSVSTWPSRSVSREQECPSSRRRRGRGGCPRRPRAGSPPSRRRRTTPAGPPRARASRPGSAPSISRRNSSGVRGLSSVPTAFTNARVPSSHTSRVAQPGDMPPTWSARRDDRRAELVGHPVADVLGHGGPRRPDADRPRRGHHQPRRSPSHCQQHLALPALVVADVRRGRRHRVVGAT